MKLIQSLSLILACTLMIPACTRKPVNQSAPMKSLGYGYMAIDPIEFWDQKGTPEDGKSDPDRPTLTCIGTVTTQTLATTKSSFDATVFKLPNAETQSLRLYSDNLVYRIVVQKFVVKVIQPDSSTKDLTVPVSLVVGIGTRIEGVLHGVKANAQITGIPGFSASFEGERKSVEASVHTVGIMSDTLLTLPRMSGEITQENLYMFFQNLATINSEINEDDTSITPHVMGFYVSQLEGNAKPYHVTTAIRWYAANKNDTQVLINDDGAIVVPLTMGP